MASMASSLSLRPITSDEVDSFFRRQSVAFSSSIDAQELELEAAALDLPRTLAVFDKDEIVGTAGSLRHELTVPGNTRVAAAAIGWVSVYPTRRRQGLLRAMMERQLADLHDLGDPVALLYSSESIIYQRYGFGIATDRVGYSIDPLHGAFAVPLDYAGTVDFIGIDDARTLFPDLHDRVRRLQPGAIDRPEYWWQSQLKHDEGNQTRFFLLARSPAGEPQGYADYRVERAWADGMRNHTMKLDELIAEDATAYLALWRMLLNLDVIRNVVTHNSPPDEPLRWRLADPRFLQVRYRNDGMWARILDVPAALNARRYAMEGRVTFEVHDRFRPETAGRFQLEGSPEGAICSRTGSRPDIVLQVEDLSAAYLGGTRFSSLARAGRVIEESAESLRRADAMFAGDPPPWGITVF